MTHEDFIEGLKEVQEDGFNPFSIDVKSALVFASELEEHSPTIGLAMKRAIQSIVEFNTIVKAEAARLEDAES